MREEAARGRAIRVVSRYPRTMWCRIVRHRCGRQILSSDAEMRIRLECGCVNEADGRMERRGLLGGGPVVGSPARKPGPYRGSPRTQGTISEKRELPPPAIPTRPARETARLRSRMRPSAARGRLVG